MFEKKIYVERRKKFRREMKSGVCLFLGNEDSPMNYAANPFLFRQDSTFLYYWGLNDPGLAAVMDLDEGTETVFGDDLTVADIVWMGPQPTLKERCKSIGVTRSAPVKALADALKKAKDSGRTIHYLPPYRGENIVKIHSLLGIRTDKVKDGASIPFIKAVVRQRNIKGDEEVREIEKALEMSLVMHTKAMELSKPGMVEHEVYGVIEGIPLSMGGRISFPVIFSVHGETLHNHYHGFTMKKGDIVVHDSGAESALHYSSDITRTFPVAGKFTALQKEAYEIVLDAQKKTIDAVKPGVPFREIHLLAGKILTEGLKGMGLMKGDTEEAVAAGAHAMFFQCGLGHMLGLDVHDMEDLGEKFVGYAGTIERSTQFGLSYLRLARPLEPGFVITVEPGLYFIPALMDQWKAEKKHRDFLNYGTLEKFRRFGGIRIEDNVLVTETGHRVLGRPIPKTVAEVEEICSR